MWLFILESQKLSKLNTGKKTYQAKSTLSKSFRPT